MHYFNFGLKNSNKIKIKAYKIYFFYLNVAMSSFIANFANMLQNIVVHTI